MTVLTADTVDALVRSAAARLDAGGVPSPRHDAETIAAHLLHRKRGALRTARPGPDFDAAYDALIGRRAAREPLQHLTGLAYFRYLSLRVGPGVFVPRPETEVLVDLVASAAGAGRVAVDLCAGAGPIGIALATEHPGTTVHLVEADPLALPWLRLNVSLQAMHMEVHHSPVRYALPALRNVDLVVANPPYLPDSDRGRLEPEVADHDPAAALWGGTDGLATIREVVALGSRLLRPGGLLGIEHDARHQPAVENMLLHSGFHRVEAHDDLAGHPRFVTAERGKDAR